MNIKLKTKIYFELVKILSILSPPYKALPLSASKVYLLLSPEITVSSFSAPLEAVTIALPVGGVGHAANILY